VDWTGPDNAGDYIYIAEPDMPDNQQVVYVRTDRGNPSELTAPGEPGQYEARYVLNVGTRVIARAPFEVTEATASFEGAPATVEAGSPLVIPWQGPDNAGDYIYIAEPDMRDNEQVVYARAGAGNPTRIDAPGAPGDYEIRYILGAGTHVIGRAPLSVTPASASFEDAPARAPADSTVTFSWTGPANNRDYVVIAEPDAPDGQYVTYQLARTPGRIELETPSEPGDYEIRYVLGAGPTAIARQPIAITE